MTLSTSHITLIYLYWNTYTTITPEREQVGERERERERELGRGSKRLRNADEYEAWQLNDRYIRLNREQRPLYAWKNWTLTDGDRSRNCSADRRKSERETRYALAPFDGHTYRARARWAGSTAICQVSRAIEPRKPSSIDWTEPELLVIYSLRSVLIMAEIVKLTVRLVMSARRADSAGWSTGHAERRYSFMFTITYCDEASRRH